MIVQFPNRQEKPQPAPTFEVFYQMHYDMVLNYLRSRCPSREDAEDITSQVFTYCYTHWSEYDPEKASPKTWLFMIARSRWIDFGRKRREFVDIDEMSNVLTDDADPMDRAMRLQAIRQELAAALKILPEQQQKAVVLRFFSDCDDAMIARRLGTTQGNVRVMISRALKRMQPMLSFALEEE